MTHSGFVIEQYVNHFLSQWNVGLEPTLTLYAKSNGEIAVSLNLTTSLASKQDEEPCSTPISRKRGRRSRQRRRTRRAARVVAGSSRENHDAGISFNDDSEDQCEEIENREPNPPVSTEPPASAACNSSSSLTSNLHQENQLQLTDEESTSEITKHPVEESAVQCSLCSNQDVVFSKRTEFLRHICVDHFNEEHLGNQKSHNRKSPTK